MAVEGNVVRTRMKYPTRDDILKSTAPPPFPYTLPEQRPPSVCLNLGKSPEPLHRTRVRYLPRQVGLRLNKVEFSRRRAYVITIPIQNLNQLDIFAKAPLVPQPLEPALNYTP